VAAASLLFTACKQEGAGTGGSATPGAAGGSRENPDMPVATWSGGTITLKAVDEKVSGQLKQLEKKKLELRQQTAEQMMLEAVVKAEAAKAGMGEEAWLKQQIEGNIPPPSDAEILKVFEENKERMPPGSTVDSMREQIIGFLQQDQRREAASKLFDQLKAKANFRMLLEEPRVQVAATGPSRGPENAPVTIVEFSDFECPFCSRAEESVTQVMEKYAGKVRLVFRHYPLPFHSNAQKAAEASACANDQGKFWDMHRQLFANQKALTVEQLKGHAATVGLDKAKFDECLDSGKHADLVKKDMAEGQEAGVTGTPAFFINGKLLSGALPASEFEKVIDAELKAKGG
jgi:predicted DsbA family dithiol-disulfide isomerase